MGAMGAAKKKGGSLKIPVRVKSKSGDCFEELNSFMACMAVRVVFWGGQCRRPGWVVVTLGGPCGGWAS